MTRSLFQADSIIIQIEKEARVAWQPLVNLLGTRTYIQVLGALVLHRAMALNYAPCVKLIMYMHVNFLSKDLWSKCNTLEAYPSKSLEPYFRVLRGPVGSSPKFSLGQ